MLRIIVISLVLANLLLLTFQASKPTLQEASPVVQNVAEDSDIPLIHLFEEMVEDRQLMFGTRQCFSLGPFHSIESRSQVRMQLRGLVAGVSERQTQALVELGYRVFLPPYESLLEANQVLLSLRALGLEDTSVIINDSEMNNAISLGYFMRQGNANRRQQQLQKRGFEAQVRVRRDMEPRFWLDYEQEPGAELLEVDMQAQQNNFRQRMLPCPELGFFSEADTEPGEAEPGQDVLSGTESDDDSNRGSDR